MSPRPSDKYTYRDAFPPLPILQLLHHSSGGGRIQFKNSFWTQHDLRWKPPGKAGTWWHQTKQGLTVFCEWCPPWPCQCSHLPLDTLSWTSGMSSFQPATCSKPSLLTLLSPSHHHWLLYAKMKLASDWYLLTVKLPSETKESHLFRMGQLRTFWLTSKGNSNSSWLEKKDTLAKYQKHQSGNDDYSIWGELQLISPT